jgi:Flp pilus assembly protein TadB
MQREGLVIALLVAGVASIAASFFTTGDHQASAAWTDQDAARFQELSRDLHNQSFTAVGTERKQRLAELQGEFDGMKSRLESAQARGKNLAWWLRAIGVALIAGGVVLRSREQVQ